MSRIALVAVVLTAAVVLVAQALGATTLKISADKAALKFNKTFLKAPAGKVTIVMTNPSALPHNVAIKRAGLKPVLGKIVLKGGKSTATATLKKGTYTFFCSVAGHEAAGMKGKLKVG